MVEVRQAGPLSRLTTGGAAAVALLLGAIALWDPPHTRTGLLFAAGLLLAGVALGWLAGSGARMGVAGWGLAAALTVAGTGAGLLAVQEDISCMYCYTERRGYPDPVLVRGFSHDDMPSVEVARELVAADPGLLPGYTVDRFGLVFDTLFWGAWSVVLAVLLSAAHRRARRSGAPAIGGDRRSPSRPQPPVGREQLAMREQPVGRREPVGREQPGGVGSRAEV